MGDKGLVCVTGASGYVGTFVVAELLARGYSVRGTVRDPKDEGKTRHLRALGDVTLVAADLMDEGSFDEAIAGCDGVIHTASVVVLNADDPQREIVDVAVKGTLNVLGSVLEAGTVKRVVQTSSVAAIIDGEAPITRPFTEMDWNESATVESAPYDVSKRDAERAAVAFRDALPEAERFELTAVHPVFVLGPVPAKGHLKTSPSLLRDVLSGKFPMAPNLAFGVVDVRDVAAAHVNALEVEAPAPRYLLTSESWTIPRIARYMRQVQPRSKAPRFRMPDPLMYVVAAFDKRVSRSFLKRNLGKQRILTNKRAREDLGVVFRPVEETLRDCAQSMVDEGWVSF